ncbi:MAG: alkaline phosphatase family protein [Nanoarchaeota archaeon]
MKIIMIDAFKPEYFEYAPYLSSLTKRFQWGELEMPIGHEGGVEVVFKGSSDKLALFYKKKNSSLKFLKYLTFLEGFGKAGRFVIDSLVNFPRFLKRYELFRTGNIPLKQLCKVEFSVNKPFYKMKGIEYTSFGDLDKIAHKYGTKSEETIKAIRELDKKISKIHFDILFSDHGMMDIHKKISVPVTDDCFIDSDMARYWGEKPKFSSKDGKWINWKDKKYGEHIFLANPGVLIFPNYWQGKIPVKAMHGYDGKNPELKGIYIAKRSGSKKNIKPEELNRIIKEMFYNGK